ncbi:MAG: hypothetical protein AAF849_20885 [Bacteroidota bacterium]
MKKLFFLLAFLSSLTLTAQEKGAPRISIFGGSGATFPFFNLSYEETGEHFFGKARWIGHSNIGGIKIYHKNGWYSQYIFADFLPSAGITSSSEKRRKYSQKYISGSVDRGIAVHVGKKIKNIGSRWYVDAFTGIYIENVRERFSGDLSLFGLQPINEEKYVGRTLHFQLGSHLTYEMKNTTLSLMLLGNIGTKYVRTTVYEATTREGNTYQATIKTKRDLLALMLKYEIYIFRKKKSPAQATLVD